MLTANRRRANGFRQSGNLDGFWQNKLLLVLQFRTIGKSVFGPERTVLTAQAERIEAWVTEHTTSSDLKGPFHGYLCPNLLNGPFRTELRDVSTRVPFFVPETVGPHRYTFINSVSNFGGAK